MINSHEFSDDPMFIRNVPGSTQILKSKSVGIAGCGGLGSNVAVLLARSGIGRIVGVDYDIVSVENLNRQHFFLDQINKPKVKALEEHLLNINPKMEFQPVHLKLDSENVKTIFADVDLLVEAFDDAAEKAMLIDSWVRMNNRKPLIGASGLSGIQAVDEIKINRTGNVIIVGDMKSEMADGLMAPRVMMVAAIQATLVVQYFLGKL